MSVVLSKAYAGYVTGALVTFSEDTEAAMVAQGLATYTGALSVNPTPYVPGSAAVVASPNGQYVITNIPIGGTALTGYETNGVAQVQGNINLTDIFVPFWNTWTGAAACNGTTVTTDRYIYTLFNSNGFLIANTTIASEGTVTATASVFQKIAFTAPVTLSPGRYYIGVTLAGAGTYGTTATTDTVRHVLSAMGAEPRSSVITCPSVVVGTPATTAAGMLAGLVSRAITTPTTFTTAQAPIVQLYST